MEGSVLLVLAMLLANPTPGGTRANVVGSLGCMCNNTASHQ